MSRDEIEFEYALQGEGPFDAARRRRRSTEAFLRRPRINPAARRERLTPFDRDEMHAAAEFARARRARYAA